MQKNLGIRRQSADTLSKKVNELKGDVDKFINENICKQYMMINKNTLIVTKTEKYLAKNKLWETSERFR